MEFGEIEVSEGTKEMVAVVRAWLEKLTRWPYWVEWEPLGGA